VAGPSPEPIAPLARRFLAFFLDGLVLVPVYVVYATVFDGLFGALVEPDPAGTGLIVVAVDPVRVILELTLTIVTDAAYYAGSWARWGMTIGQRACGVAVRVASTAPTSPSGRRRAAGEEPGVLPPGPAAAARWAVLQLPPLCVGMLGSTGALPVLAVAWLNVAWFGLLAATIVVDPLRRGLHDRVAGTVVVRMPGFLGAR
jgi:uncharacterized RDD family membrane protein YckC